MTVIADAVALAGVTRATVAHVRADPHAPGNADRLAAAIVNLSGLRCRADVAAADMLARARARLASLDVGSSNWQRQKAARMAEAARDMGVVAAELLNTEAEVRALAVDLSNLTRAAQ